jgi:hypothetical protein
MGGGLSVLSLQSSVGKEKKGFGLKEVAPPHVFFVSVASKELRFPVSPLKSTLMGIFVSVASKRLRVHQTCAKFGLAACEKVTPSPVWFLKRYDSKGLRRWGFANDMIPWELENWGRGIQFRPRKKMRDRGVLIAATTNKEYQESRRCVNYVFSYHSNEFVRC